MLQNYVVKHIFIHPSSLFYSLRRYNHLKATTIHKSAGRGCRPAQFLLSALKFCHFEVFPIHQSGSVQ